jgi:1-acyl-sn-glycerol-3-phosphate acyltransferase
VTTHLLVPDLAGVKPSRDGYHRGPMSQSRLLGQRRFGPFFLAQFTGAFNDNALKQAIIILFTLTMSHEEAEQVSQLATALFIAPYFFFSATAGQLAEKMEKGRLIQLTKLFELAIIGVATIGFYLHSLPFLLTALTMLGLQATFFGPVKYAILPQVLKPEELVGGNGLVEMGTYVAILVGEIAGAQLVAIEDRGPFLVSALMLTIAVLGYVSARAIPPVPSKVPDLAIGWNLFAETWRVMRFALEVRSVWLSILGISWFWLFGALLMIQLPVFVSSVIGGATSVFTLCLVIFSLGVGLGSLLCERLSRGQIELGLVPFGAIGLTLFGIDLFFSTEHHVARGVDLGWQAVVMDSAHWRMLLDFGLIGVFGGFYSVPLFAIMQSRSDPAKRSRIIAANNVLNSLFIVGAAALSFVGRSVLELSIPQVFLAAALLNALVAAYIFTLLPEFLLRFLTWLAMSVMYRLSIRGVEKVPDEGPALVVANHVSFVDGFLVGAAVRRPIRFVMYYKIYQLPVLNWLFRWGRAIPIAGRKEDEALMERAFAEVKKALAEGELVGIFPEGMITYSGEMNEFRPGVERILEETPVPVIPMALRGLWGSWFSRSDGIAMVKLPKRFWSKVEIAVGTPVPAVEATSERLFDDVKTLRGDRR